MEGSEVGACGHSPKRQIRVPLQELVQMMNVIRSAILGVLAVAFVSAAQPSAAAVRRVLLSVDGLSLPQGKDIYAFHIDTFGVEFVAVCSVPRGWELKSEKYENPEGYISGKADLHASRLRFARMYLVDVYDYQARSDNDGHPASFSGWVQIGSREQFGDWRGRKVTLRPNNFRLADAGRCPVPPPPLP
jgi:hypothetical protein